MAPEPQPLPEQRRRVVIENVAPEIEGGRFPAKGTIGEGVLVEADAFADGHDVVTCALRHRKKGSRTWREARMEAPGNDRWQGEFEAPTLGLYQFTIEAWVDHFRTWSRDLSKRVEAGQDVAVELEVGARLVEETAARCRGAAVSKLSNYAELMRSPVTALKAALSQELARLMDRHSDRSLATRYGRELEVVIEPEKARFSAWYELFPRSWGKPGKHGTFKDLEGKLDYVAGMGFDVLYLPPIHPIGRSHRKGPNNNPAPAPDDPGSPWAIGSSEGGHTAVNPQLGTLGDFRHLLRTAAGQGLQVALDLAFQCSPDHPWVTEHPQWFKHRPDGTIQYAENPPKKYQDIYPLDFETDDWRALWRELLEVTLFWIAQGVLIFRVDNPHTKPFAFWEWMIGEVKRDHPNVLFLAEAFTRPKVMYRLAKLGFSQSYTYFAWRNSSRELAEYFTELTRGEAKDFFRPNLWPNTPDILTEYLQHGGRPAFAARLLLAATLGSSYGIYGPAFELLENRPREAGSEEYLDSEKYEIKRWELSRPESLAELIGLINKIRIENAALHSNRGLRFHETENEALIAYTKASPDLSNLLLTVVNLDPYRTQAGMISLPLEELGLDPALGYQAHDLLSGARYMWYGPRNFVELNPYGVPGHVLRLRQLRAGVFEYFA
jgi:starch synthase (maltosyl-transferring)